MSTAASGARVDPAALGGAPAPAGLRAVPDDPAVAAPLLAPGTLDPDHPFAPLLPLGLGDVRLVPVPARPGATSAVALVGDPLRSIAPLVRLHRGCLLGDALGHGDCGRPAELVRAFRRLREDGAGVLVYHRDDRVPGRGCCGDGPGRRPLGVPEASPALEALAATIAGLGLRPARLLLPARPDPDALEPRVLRLPVVRTVVLGPPRLVGRG